MWHMHGSYCIHFTGVKTEAQSRLGKSVRVMWLTWLRCVMHAGIWLSIQGSVSLSGYLVSPGYSYDHIWPAFLAQRTEFFEFCCLMFYMLWTCLLIEDLNGLCTTHWKTHGVVGKKHGLCSQKDKNSNCLKVAMKINWDNVCQGSNGAP